MKSLKTLWGFRLGTKSIGKIQNSKEISTINCKIEEKYKEFKSKYFGYQNACFTEFISCQYLVSFFIVL